MKIVMLGSGNVATQLSIALKKAGQEILQIYSRHLNHAQQLTLKLGGQAVDSLNEVITSADVYLIAVKDDAIVDVLQHLNTVNGIVAHTSGATNLNVFPADIKSFGVFYPLQTFSKERNIDFQEVPICIEANNKAGLRMLETLATQLSKKVYQINSEERKALHVAAVFACNFSNHMYALAADILGERELNFDLLKPLISETAAKVMEHAPAAVQTGPAVRHDEVTMASQLNWLDASPDLERVYKCISESIKLKHRQP